MLKRIEDSSFAEASEDEKGKSYVEASDYMEKLP